jgi:hypothetical protein
VGSPGHNVIHVDGKVQNRGPSSVRNAMRGNHLVRPEFDYAHGSFGSFRGLKGKATHTRAVVYVRGACWVVVDRIASDAARGIEALWHFHPDCTVKPEGLAVASTDAGNGNLRIVPAGGPRWKLKMVKGQTKPSLQGWYSPTYNVKQPCPTAVYAARVNKQATFAWVMIPAKGTPHKGAVRVLGAPAGASRVQVSLPGKAPIEVAVRLAGKAAVPLSGGLKLDGQCAILRKGAAPLVVGGRVTGTGNKVLASHAYDVPKKK